jgi:hypothetical protein
VHARLRRFLMRLDRISAIGEQVHDIAEKKQKGITAAEPRGIQDIWQMGDRERVRARGRHSLTQLLQSILRKQTHKKGGDPCLLPFNRELSSPLPRNQPRRQEEEQLL